MGNQQGGAGFNPFQNTNPNNNNKNQKKEEQPKR